MPALDESSVRAWNIYLSAYLNSYIDFCIEDLEY